MGIGVFQGREVIPMAAKKKPAVKGGKKGGKMC